MRRGNLAAVTAAVTALLVPVPALAARRTPAPHRGATTHRAAAGLSSLPSGLTPRPGPALLYEPPAVAPQLTNRPPFRAAPILVSGASAYRRGEFLYQDYLYDDHGARGVPDLTDPRAGANASDLFSKPNGTYTYPTAPGFAHDAADLVELRVKPLRTATAVRVTLNTLTAPYVAAVAVAIGGTAGRTFPFPDGANVVAPADLFLTVHPSAAGYTAELTRAAGGTLVARLPVLVDAFRRQLTVRVPHRLWNPRRRTVRLAAAAGLWDRTAGHYLLPGRTADATHPGGAPATGAPAAFFNVAFRTHEPVPSPTEGIAVETNAAWWRDRDQGTALAAGDLSPLFAMVDFGKLARGVIDDSGVPQAGPIDRILSSHVELAPGADFSRPCGLPGSSNPESCVPAYTGRLQPYAIYVPRTPRPAAGYGLTLLLHSLSANYNQYLGTRNQSQFGDRAPGSIVVTPEARGPDGFYANEAAADTFEVWADVAHRYRLDPALTELTGYSMGGIGTFRLGEQYPDLFARAQPTVGDEANTDLIASLRNVPVLMWNNSADELVNPALYTPDGLALANLGYRYELDVFAPCPTTPNAAACSPLFPDHLELAVNDQFAPAAAFLGDARVDRDPPHVTYVAAPRRDDAGRGLVADHAYWISALRLRDPAANGPSGKEPEGSIDAVSHGFGVGDPAASALQVGLGTLTGGHLGPVQFSRFAKSWGPAPAEGRRDALDVTVRNLAAATVDPRRARLTCAADVHVTTDGPVAITLAGCGRTVRAD